jgi:hypothetical protein
LVQEAARAECEFGTPCCEEVEISAVCWPCRSREALADALAQRDAERDGQLAALRGALEVLADADCDRDDGIECIKFDPRSTEYCAICRAKTALATGAGKREGAVLAAAAVLRRTPRMVVDNEGDRILNPEYTVAEEHFNQAVDTLHGGEG